MTALKRLLNKRCPDQAKKVNLSHCVHAAQTNAATGISFLSPDFLLLLLLFHFIFAEFEWKSKRLIGGY